MRLFTAIDPPAETAERLEALLETLRPSAPLRWSRAENLHITTKFIGEWPEARLDEMLAALSGIAPPGPVGVRLRGLGYFPNERQPRVFWLGVDGGTPLVSLAQLTDTAVFALGVPRERNPYRPHLTLARLKPDKDPPAALGALRRAVRALPEPDCGEFTAHEWHLYRSDRDSSGSRYFKIGTFPLT